MPDLLLPIALFLVSIFSMLGLLIWLDYQYEKKIERVRIQLDAEKVEKR